MAGLVRPSVDLDGDGTPDLIWASCSNASLVAVSGKSGKLLWCHECRAALPGKFRAEEIQCRFGPISGTVVGEPLLAEGGGKKIVAALFALDMEMIVTKSGKWVQGGRQLWLEALNAQTGEPLWRRPLPWINQKLMSSALYAAKVWKQNHRTIGVIACENRLFGFDMLTGQPAWADRELDAKTPLVVRFADLRGDGELDVLLLRATPNDTGGRSYPGRNPPFQLTALSPHAATPLWERTLKDLGYPMGYSFRGDWPLPVDLDGKGKPKVVVPFVDSDADSCGLEVLDGATGERCWKQRLSRSPTNCPPPEPDRIVLGPDLDGDGYREIFAASYNWETHHFYVDALSGQDGRILWSNQQSTFNAGQAGILPLRWWQPGNDGWPLLVVPCSNNIGFAGGEVQTYILAASTGRVEHELTGCGQPEVFNVNGDGLPDLLVHDFPQTNNLRAIEGLPPVAWRATGQILSPRQDFNADGYTDFLSLEGVAVSGRDASVLWRSDALRGSVVVSNPLPEADLDGDGSPDLLSMQGNSSKVVATSGRDGKTLWRSDRLSEDNTIWCVNNLTPPHLAGHILEEGKQADVLVLFQRYASVNRATFGQPLQTCLARLSGRDGRIVWKQALTDFSGLDIRTVRIPFTTADLDGDGVKDLVFWLPVPAAESPAAGKNNQQAGSKSASGETPPSSASGKTPPSPMRPLCELRAYSGRDGTLLWRRPGFFAAETGPPGFKLNFLRIPAPVICDPNGDGHPLVLVTDQGLPPGGAPGLRVEVLALDGKNGKEKWSWCGEGVSANLFDGPLERGEAWPDASPQVVRTAAGPAIVVSAFDESLRTHVDPKTKVPTPTKKSGSVIVVLSVGGKVLHKIEDESPDAWANFVNSPAVRPRLWVHDLLGDGHEELVWWDGRRVRAKRAEAEGMLWQWERPTSSAAMGYLAYPICGIQPAGKGYPATVAVASYNGMLGLAGPTGKVRWRCDAAHLEASSVLESDDPQGLPRILSMGPGSERTSHMALAVDDRGGYVLPKSAPRQYDASRWPLPWARREGEQVLPAGYTTYMPGIFALASIIGWWPGKLAARPGSSACGFFPG